MFFSSVKRFTFLSDLLTQNTYQYGDTTMQHQDTIDLQPSISNLLPYHSEGETRMKSGSAAVNWCKRFASLLLVLLIAMPPGFARAERTGRNVRVGWYESPFNISSVFFQKPVSLQQSSAGGASRRGSNVSPFSKLGGS